MALSEIESALISKHGNLSKAIYELSTSTGNLTLPPGITGKFRSTYSNEKHIQNGLVFSDGSAIEIGLNGNLYWSESKEWLAELIQDPVLANQ